MTRGSINHLAVTAGDFARSIEFYGKVLGFMGYVRRAAPESAQQPVKPRLIAWSSPNGSFTLWPAKAEPPFRPVDRNQPGAHHLAFNAAGRADVDKLYELLKEIGAKILDPPAEYPYSPGYYAVFFTDPDGLKLEFVFVPRP